MRGTRRDRGRPTRVAHRLFAGPVPPAATSPYNRAVAVHWPSCCHPAHSLASGGRFAMSTDPQTPPRRSASVDAYRGFVMLAMASGGAAILGDLARSTDPAT